MDRERKVDVSKLSEEQFAQVQEGLSKKVKEVLEKANSDLNKYLNVYGLEALLGVQLVKQGEANLIKEHINSLEKGADLKS